MDTPHDWAVDTLEDIEEQKPWFYGGLEIMIPTGFEPVTLRLGISQSCGSVDVEPHYTV